MDDKPVILNGAPLRNRSHASDTMFVRGLGMIWRRRRDPIIGAGVGLALGLMVLLVTPSLYSASSRILIDSNAEILKSEAAIMESPPVFSKVAGVLGLYRDKEFNGAGVNGWIFGNEENVIRDRVLSRLDGMTHVSILPGTGIIEINVRNRNPDRAAQIANAMLSAYQERKADEQFEQSRQIGGWMSKRLQDIREQSAEAKKKLGDFQSAHGLIALGGADMKAERMALLNRAMAQAQEDIASLSNRLDQAKQGAGYQAMGDVLHSDRINALKKSESRVAAELAEMKERYGDRHPKIIAQRAALAKIRSDIKKETTNVVNSIGQDLQAATGRIESLQEQIDTMSTGADVDGQLKLQLQNLEADVAATERLYTDFLVKYQDVMAQSELRMTDIKVLSMATIPSQPDTLLRWMMVARLIAIGFLCGLGVAILRILLNTGFVSAAQLESMTGYPVFAAVPLANLKGEAVHHHVAQDPAAILAESLRTLRISLRLRGETGKRPRVIAFTSTLPDEGKTSLAVMLGLIAAKSGERVCIVDCDLRRPTVHKAFAIGNARGLSDYLSDRLGVDEIIHRKDPSGVHLITSKAVPSHSLTLLTSGRMENLIENLREQYDLVILDAPSSLAFADARVLARMVDQTMYVVAWNRTRRESVMSSLKAYADMHYADLALVLNKVDLSEYLRDSATAVLYQYGHEALSPA